MPNSLPEQKTSTWRADATVYIDAMTHDAAQEQMEDWVVEHMPSNFVIGWTLMATEEEEMEDKLAEIGEETGK